MIGDRARRIATLRKKTGLSRNALGKLVGVSHVAVGKWENETDGDSIEISHTNMEKLAKALNSATSYIQHGFDQTPATHHGVISPPGDEGDSDPYEYVTKVRGAKVSAGTGHISFEHEEIHGSHAFRRVWLQERGIRSVDRSRIIAVNGMSMWPYLNDGDVVLFNLDDVSVRNGEPYVLAYDDELLVKRLHKTADGALEIRSDNPDKDRYPTERVEGERMNLIRILGRVVWRGG